MSKQVIAEPGVTGVGAAILGPEVQPVISPVAHRIPSGVAFGYIANTFPDCGKPSSIFVSIAKAWLALRPGPLAYEFPLNPPGI